MTFNAFYMDYNGIILKSMVHTDTSLPRIQY